MTEIKLSNSDRVAIVDDALAPLLNTFRWRIKKSAFNTYVCTSIRQGDKVWTVRMHRYIYDYVFGPIPAKHDIHHIDHDTFNNSIDNLEPIDKKRHGRETRLYA